MRYWLYSEGNINGPYAMEELAVIPSFSPSSLVCSEGATGTNSEDWKTAGEIPELAKLLSVGILSGAASDAALRPDVIFPYQTDKSADDQSYSALLDTIDNILNAYKNEEVVQAVTRPEIKNDDFEIVDKFDIRIAKIQEDLEAARWEKNVLLERLRLKEEEERKDKKKIDELEKKLKDILKRLENNEKVVYVEKGAEEKEKAEIAEKIEKIKEMTAAAQQPAVKMGEGTAQGIKEADKEEGKSELAGIELKKISSLRKTESAAPESLIDRKDEKKEDVGDMSITSRQLKRLGAEKPEKLFDDLPAEKQEMKPLPMQESGLVYDFTVVTPSIETKESDKVSFKIEPRGAAPPSREVSPFETGSHRSRPTPLRQPQPSIKQPEPAQDKPVEAPFNLSRSAHKKEDAPAHQPAVQAHAPLGIIDKEAAKTTQVAEIPKKEEPRKEDIQKTVRVVSGRAQEARESGAAKGAYPKGKSKTKFLVTIAAFAVVAVGGIFYFFSGGGEGVADVALRGVRGGKKASMDTELAQSGPSGIPGSTPETQEQASSENGPSVSEKVKKSIDIVKNYNLADGKGTVSNWFSNTFSSSKQVSEEWSSTLLQGNVFVVQYRLIRQKRDPLVYQFEVDVEKGVINRGINNNAIELLESSARPQSPASKRPKQIVSRKTPKKKKQSDLLPLPDEKGREETTEPTGFENADSINTGAVKITAPESDEELF